MLLKEIKNWSRVNHPNVLPILGFYPRILRYHMIDIWLITPYDAYSNIVEYIRSTLPDDVVRFRLVSLVMPYRAIRLLYQYYPTQALQMLKGLAHLHHVQICHGAFQGVS